MKTGEVAIENSVNAFHDHKTSKLKSRVTSTHYASHAHYYSPQIYQTNVYTPFQMQYAPSPYAPAQYAHVPVVPAYQRFSSADPRSKMVPPGYLYQQLPYPSGSFKRPMRTSQMPHATVAPVSAPMRPIQMSNATAAPASAPNPIRTQDRRPLCVQFLTRGFCSYGSACKYAHDKQSGPPVPHSAPTLRDDEKKLHHGSRTSGSSKHRRHSSVSLLEDEFPSLSVETRRGDDSESNQLQDDGAVSPSRSKLLVFRDAVLNQKSSPQRMPASPTKSLTNSDEGWSDCGEEDEAGAGNNEDTHQKAISKDDDTEGGTTRRLQDAISQISADKLYSSEAVSKRTRYQSYQTQMCLPESGQHRYAIRKVYAHPETVDVDDSSAFSSLSRECAEFVKRVNSKLRVVLSHQQRAIECLQEISYQLWSDAEVDLYGSNHTRLALPASDVDCVISVPSRTNEEPVELLRQIANATRQHTNATRVELLESAKIPVLKIIFGSCSKSHSEVMLDLTCAHSPGHSGLSARDLIYSLQVEMPALRPLVLILKSHLQRHGLNCAFTGGLSSYGLVLMTIRFLQACGDEHHVTDVPSKQEPHKPLTYEFSRAGQLTWRTRIGNLLLLFLETYVTFDYRRFGIRIDQSGAYFPIPRDKISTQPGPVVSPYIVDPIKPSRTIGNTFRMHEVVQAWYTLYQQVTTGVALEDALSASVNAVPFA